MLGFRLDISGLPYDYLQLLLALMTPVSSTMLAHNQAYTLLPQDMLPNLIISRRLSHNLAPSHENPPGLSPPIEREVQSIKSNRDQDVDPDDSEEHFGEEDYHDEVRRARHEKYPKGSSH